MQEQAYLDDGELDAESFVARIAIIEVALIGYLQCLVQEGGRTLSCLLLIVGCHVGTSLDQ